MAETLTVDTSPDTETSLDNLTPEEQDSLALGEQMAQDQEQLLAGKYKNAEELERAYKELETKLGEQEAAKEKPEAEAEEKPDNSYLEDGSVNYEAVTETYGAAVTEKLEAAGIDPWAISKEFHEKDGQYTPEMVEQLTKAGFSEAAVKSYFAGRAAENGYGKDTEAAESSTDISEAQIADIKQAAGGDQAYANIINWAKEGLSKDKMEAFNEVVETGSVAAIKLAVSGLQTEYNNANGVEGKMVTGKTAPPQPTDVYRSQAELVAAMNDPKYDNDPAYRQDVIEKLERSDLEF
tara:strand:+ start:413 stop:1294 length:882 start_codon:yes stop_codon:yes gene_type:complete